MAAHDQDAGVNGGLDVLEHVEVHTDKGWNVILWNDPVNTTVYVTAVLMRILEIDKEAAERLMMSVHLDGKGAVYHGEHDKAEAYVLALQTASLWATLERV